jgi:hypothetical protein
MSQPAELFGSSGYSWWSDPFRFAFKCQWTDPKRFNWLNKPLNLAKITVVIYILAGLFAGIHPFRYFVYKNVTLANNSTVQVLAGCVLSNSLTSAFNFLNLAHKIFSFIVILIANVCIIHRLFASKRAVSRNSEP